MKKLFVIIICFPLFLSVTKCNPYGPAVLETVATPTILPESGTYTTAQDVTISSTTSEATIYCTTDGENPTTSSNLYAAAIPVSVTTTIKAFAVKSGMTDSSVASVTYTIPPLPPLSELIVGTWVGVVAYPDMADVYVEIIYEADGTCASLSHEYAGGPLLDDRSLRGTYVVDGDQLTSSWTEMWWTGAWHTLDPIITNVSRVNAADIDGDTWVSYPDFDGDGAGDATWTLTKQ